MQNHRLTAVAGLLLFVTITVVYLTTMPPGITFEDAPAFAAVCYTRGIAHPPGFPLHTLLCWPLSHLADILPISPAKASALASVLPAALACVLIGYISNHQGNCLAASVFAGGLLALVVPFWRQSIIPEAYGLNVLLIAVAMAVVASYVRYGGKPKLVWFALICGLGLANHWPLFVIPGPALIIWLLARGRHLFSDLLEPKWLVAIVLAFLAGLLPFLHLLYPAEGSFRFLGGDVDRLWWYISRQVYGVGGIQVSTLERVDNALETVWWVVEGFAYVFFIMGLFGAWRLYRSGNKLQVAACAWAVLSCTLLLALLRPFDDKETISRWVFSVYPLPAYLWFSLLVASGCNWLFQRKFSVVVQWSVCLLALGTMLIWHYPEVDRSEDDFATRYGEVLWQELPEQTTLILPHDDYSFVIDYQIAVERRRNDIAAKSERDLFIDLDVDYKLTVEQQQQLDDLQPVAFISDYQLSQSGKLYNGLYFTIDDTVPLGKTEVKITPEVREFYWSQINRLKAGETNAWTRLFLQLNVSDLAKRLSIAQDIDRIELSAEDFALLQGALTTVSGRYGRFIALATGGVMTTTEIATTVRSLQSDLAKINRRWQSDALHLLGTVYLLTGSINFAIDQFEQALAIYPKAENHRVIIDLLQTYSIFNRYEEYQVLRQRFPNLLISGDALDKTDQACAQYFGTQCKIVE